MQRIACLLLPLVLFLVTPVQAVDTVVLAWDPYTDTNVNSLRIYSGQVTNPAAGGGVFVAVPRTDTLIALTNVVAGVTYFQATAVNFQGIESIPSNTVIYTNRHFGPVNLRITGSTNNTAAIWVERTSASIIVQWSADFTNWRGWAAVQSLDASNPLGEAIFLAGLKPDAAQYWRAVSPPPQSFSPAALPAGIWLSPSTPPLPTR